MPHLYESAFKIAYLRFFQLLKPQGLLCKVDFIHALVSGEARRPEQGSGWWRPSRDKRRSLLCSSRGWARRGWGASHQWG